LIANEEAAGLIEGQTIWEAGVVPKCCYRSRSLPLINSITIYIAEEEEPSRSPERPFCEVLKFSKGNLNSRVAREIDREFVKASIAID
jgi:hypothetical protein